MKITKTRLMEIIKEELKERDAPQLTPEQKKVISLMRNLISAIEAMGQSVPEMTDTYLALLIALKNAGAGAAVQKFVRYEMDE